MSQQDVWLVTGASGFIGRHLCASLLADGQRVIALSRKRVRAARVLGDAVQVVEQLAEIGADQTVDVVVNLAGEPLVSGRWNETRKQRFVDSRVATTRQLVAWIAGRQSPPKTLISGSAIGFYGSQGSRILAEGDDPEGGFSHRLCQQWEDCAREAENSGVRVCLLRTGVVLGRDGGSLKAMLPAFRLGLGGRLGSGEQWMSWIHIDDMVRSIRYLAERQTLVGPFNATAPYPVINAEFSRTLAAVLRRPLLLPVPAGLLRLVFGELADELLLASQRVLPACLQEAGFDFQHPHLREALTDLLGRAVGSRRSDV